MAWPINSIAAGNWFACKASVPSRCSASGCQGRRQDLAIDLLRLGQLARLVMARAQGQCFGDGYHAFSRSIGARSATDPHDLPS